MLGLAFVVFSECMFVCVCVSVCVWLLLGLISFIVLSFFSAAALCEINYYYNDINWKRVEISTQESAGQ